MKKFFSIFVFTYLFWLISVVAIGALIHYTKREWPEEAIEFDCPAGKILGRSRGTNNGMEWDFLSFSNCLYCVKWINHPKTTHVTYRITNNADIRFHDDGEIQTRVYSNSILLYLAPSNRMDHPTNRYKNHKP